MKYSFTKEEETLFTLRYIWSEKGYKKYRLSQAEEYDFYVRNKEFLDNREIISFTDKDGVLMALKPDITLSLVRSIEDIESEIQRIMYFENVYRIPQLSESFKEIMQTGLECFGPLTKKEIVEVVELAQESLELINSNYYLSISHMGVINSLLKGIDKEDCEIIIENLKRRNISKLRKLANEKDYLKRNVECFITLLSETLTKREICTYLRNNDVDNESIVELEAIINENDSERIVFDFSQLGAFGYYNGLILKGYIYSSPIPILRGGEYSLLLKKMEKKIKRAIGFALYMNEIEEREND